MGALLTKSINKARTLLTKTYEGGTEHHHFWCPACKELHLFQVGRQDRPVWTFDGNFEKPTFHPSLRYLDASRCHMHVEQGILKYCNDCPHEMKGKHIPLPQIPLDNLLFEGIDVQPCGCVNHEQPEWEVFRNFSKCDHHKACGGKGGLDHYREMGCFTPDPESARARCVGELTEPLEAMGVPPLSLYQVGTRRALEVGAGVSLYCTWLRSLGYDYRAIEPDAEAAAWSRENLGAYVYGETFEQYRERNEPKPHLILAAHVLEHMYHAPDVLKSFYHGLEPGGRLLLIVPDDTDRMNPDHLWFFTEPALKSLLQRVGFSDVRTAVRRRVAHENFIYVSAVKNDST